MKCLHGKTFPFSKGMHFFIKKSERGGGGGEQFTKNSLVLQAVLANSSVEPATVNMVHMRLQGTTKAQKNT